MKLLVLAIGHRQPAWADAAWEEFAKRFPPELPLALQALKAEPRQGAKTAVQAMAAEGARIEAALARERRLGLGARRIVLDERGTRLTTAQLADRLRSWRAEGRDAVFVIGGPDGLDAAVRERADETWRLSDLTLPHALARVLLAEALYRAHTLIEGHPYHRA